LYTSLGVVRRALQVGEQDWTRTFGVTDQSASETW